MTKEPTTKMGSHSRGQERLPSPQNYFKPAPAEIVHGPMRFLITDRPNNVNISQYIEQLQKHNATVVVRVCEPTYDTERIVKEGIDVKDWEFSDGSPPPNEIREQWLLLVKNTFKENKNSCIAVHCVAGLGRAPVLVALALMEAGMKYEDAVETIRSRRRGAINQKQLSYLEKYKPSGELKKLINGKKGDKDCCIM